MTKPVQCHEQSMHGTNVAFRGLNGRHIRGSFWGKIGEETPHPTLQSCRVKASLSLSIYNGS